MDEKKPRPLLGPSEPPPFVLENKGAGGSVVIVCEHAGRRIPSALGTLGLGAEQLLAHYMWDLGALDLARALAGVFDAPLVHQPYSRMVCDCNRRPDVESFIPNHGEGTPVRGNESLDAGDRDQRRSEIWQVFHDGVTALLDGRERAGRPTFFVTIHSFTPVFHGEPRPWQAGVLFERDRDLAPAVLDFLVERHGDAIGHNEPYSMARDTDYTVPVHGEDRGLPSVEIEVRNDLIADPGGIERWTAVLAEALRSASRSIGERL